MRTSAPSGTLEIEELDALAADTRVRPEGTVWARGEGTGFLRGRGCARRSSVLGGGAARFVTTRWNLVLRAALAAPGSDPPIAADGQPLDDESARQARQALAELCGQYWYPVYAFIRRRRGAEHASDLTQKFILSLIEKNSFAQADPSRGRFRSWLLGAVKHFLSNEARYEAAARRHAGSQLSIDELVAERRYACEPRSEVTPEHLYDRAFSLCVLERAIERLGEELAARGQSRRFEVIKRLLPGPELEDGAYAPMAASLGVSPNNFKKIVFDCRARFRAILEAVIADLIEVPDEHDQQPEPAAAEAKRTCIAEEREFLARALSLPPS
jgi:DNA-directed RNA polymerase specialized sigma24 family protein